MSDRCSDCGEWMSDDRPYLYICSDCAIERQMQRDAENNIILELDEK